jgi:hypothetical protein
MAFDFARLIEQAKQVAGLFDNARDAWVALKGNVADGKAALNATQLSELEAQLEAIHGKNMALSAELDDTLAQIQARG